MAEKGEIEKSDYLNLLKATRKQVDEKYEKVIQIFQDKKFSLQTIIDDLEAEYLEVESVRENELAKLESVMLIYEESPGDNRVNEVRERVRKGIREEIDNLRANRYEKDVSFVWDNELEKKIERLGRIEVNNENTIPDQHEIPPFEFKTAFSRDAFLSTGNYGIIDCPQVESYSTGSEPGQLNSPGGVAMCQDDTFYVADHNNNRVSAYTQWGKLKFSFQQPALMGMVNRMQGPWGVCCYENHIYVTESRRGNQHAALKKFTLNGECITDLTKFGTNNGEFIDPTGLDIDEERKELYVCDRGNNRVQVFSPQVVFIKIFVAKMIYQPRDVKVGSRLVFILDENDPCVHLFHKDTGRICEHVQLQGYEKPVKNPWFFALDKNGNILISDRDNNLIQIFSQDGKLLFVLGDDANVSFIRPTGIAVNASGNIISVCMKETGCLQIL